MGKELVQRTNLKREIGWMYFLDKEGDICRGKMGALIQVNPAKYAKPEKVIRLGIKREKGYLYFIGKDGCVYRTEMDKKTDSKQKTPLMWGLM